MIRFLIVFFSVCLYSMNVSADTYLCIPDKATGFSFDNVQREWVETSFIPTKKFLVKKIFVKPGGVLSLQSHEHRSEHWIVAEGEAEVTIDKKVINLKENENIFIPKGAIHRMANRKDRDLVIIEMWYGEILDENDIKRYDENYNYKFN